VAASPEPTRIEWIGDCPWVIPTLSRWHVDAFADTCRGWAVQAAAFELRGHASRRALPTTLVAMAGDTPLGSVSLLDSDPPAPDRHAPWLGTLFVHADARRCGLGARLVAAATQEARALGLPCLHLWTPRHEAFYARLGWQALGRQRFGGIEVGLMRRDCAAT